MTIYGTSNYIYYIDMSNKVLKPLRLKTQYSSCGVYESTIFLGSVYLLLQILHITGGDQKSRVIK